MLCSEFWCVSWPCQGVALQVSYFSFTSVVCSHAVQLEYFATNFGLNFNCSDFIGTDQIYIFKI